MSTIRSSSRGKGFSEDGDTNLDRFADAYLVECAKEGDRMALRMLCLRHFDDAYGYASFRSGPRKAESVVREAFATVVNDIQREELAVPFGVRLYAALRQAASDPGRDRNGNGNGVARNGHRIRLDELSDPAFATLIGGLEPDQQEALLLTHVLHLRPNEVATAMHRTQRSVGELETEAIGALAGQLSG